ncbi:hypothetical protein M9978_21070 [Sphingomonas sp. MG17]|uniref:Tetratricopeptide repeat protein n=1 Tax=Sphingomonas tagetis TaxID=2949092 RepID=A0A9X2KNL3_9SPHN|nr:hypothetical protein [Sphingomonas tagetis]MCP3732912.1 hypothetical protein [Sphingomonas tagetis]
MSCRRDLARRSPKEWAVRLALAAVAAVFGFYSATFSIAQEVVKRDPALAYRLAPYDGRMTAAYAMSLAGPRATPGDRVRADVLAKRALQQDPTAVAAVTTLGVNADFRGDKAAARRYFAYAQKLSRRDLPTQLFMIEDAVQRGDIPGALHHYDITLRVSPQLSEMLYPVLASASEDPSIRAALVKTLAGKPAWGSSFIDYAAGHGSNPQATIDLLSAVHRAGVAVPERAHANVVNALLAAGQADAAWKYYAAIRPGSDRRRSRNPQFLHTIETPSQLDWNPVNEGGLSTGIQTGIFDFAAPSSVGGPMLQQWQLLIPGIYRLSVHSIGIEQAKGALPYWTLRCMDGRELGRIDVPNSNVSNGNSSGMFSVPKGCPAQTLILMARPSDAVSGLSGQIDRVTLAPAR